jgi:hypothetical protein
MDAMLTGLMLLLLFVVAVSALPFGYAAWRRVFSREGDLQIWQAMRRRGLAAEDLGNDAVLARAVRRCVMCPSILECDDWLASGNKDGLAKFCPNERVLADLETKKAARHTP